ncbi:MAG TPA: hypothetical protein VF910_00880 [Candidatus Bathyarchaeia archaeon]
MQQAQQVLALGNAFRLRQTELANRAASALQASRRGERAVKAFRDSLAHAPTPHDTIRIQGAVNDLLVAQRDSLTIAEAYQRARAERAESRVTLLEANLRATLMVADCHIGGLRWLPRCPGRTLSFLIGAGGASIALLAMHH